MSYINQKKHDRHHDQKIHRTVVDTATPMTWYIKNGATANFAFPCFYQEIHHPKHVSLHSRRLHDHYGWPSPNHADHICQPGELVMEMLHSDDTCNPCDIRSLIDMSKLIPIHLIEEGYTSAVVSFADTIPGLNVSKVWIDVDDDWIVRAIISAEVPDAVKKKIRTGFQVQVRRTDENDIEIRDIVCDGVLVILPSTYPG